MTTPHGQSLSCRLCGAVLDARELDLGRIPIGNRFTKDGDVDRHPLSMTACTACGLVQLTRFPSTDAIVPRVPWIRYNEPDQHLDAALAKLALPKARRAVGTGPFDKPLLDRLGSDTADLIDLRERSTLHPYLETFAARLSDGSLDARVSEKADVVVCRYILEHCHAPLTALASLGAAATDDGVVIVEVPDSAPFMRRLDYSFPWEEHALYFTETTLASMCKRAGFGSVEIIRSPGALEDSLLAVLRKGAAEVVPDRDGAALFEAYRDRFADVRAAWTNSLRHEGKVALFGAGHQAIMFVNALGLNDLVAAMVDDSPDKKGLVAPGLTSPVISSAEMLADSAFTTCLLAVSPRVESAIKQKLAPFRERGGVFHSISNLPEAS